LPRIIFVWTVRQGFLLSLFCDHLMEIIRSHFSLDLISIKIYYTAVNPICPPGVPLEIQSVITCGARPDLSNVFFAAKQRCLSSDVEPSAVHTIVCGPEPLISSVQSFWCATPPFPFNLSFGLSLLYLNPFCSLQNNFTFFSEDFYF
jgi:hypothetical protein